MESEVAIELLKNIRDEIRETRVSLSERIDATNTRIDAMDQRIDGRLESTNSRIDGTNTRLERLERRQVEMEVRLATEIVALNGAVGKLVETLQADRGVRVTVRDHEKRITALEKRPPRR